MHTKQYITLEEGCGDTLKCWRKSAGLTQRELGRLACVARASISHIETGRYLPTAAFAGKISRALSAVLGGTVNTWDLFPGVFPRLPVAQRKLAKRPPSAPARAAQRRAKRYKLQHTNEYTCNSKNNQVENQERGSAADETQGRQG